MSIRLKRCVPRIRALCLLALIAAGVDCTSTYTSPSEPTLVGLKILTEYPIVSSWSGVLLTAFAVHSDGAYLDVTGVADWTTSRGDFGIAYSPLSAKGVLLQGDDPANEVTLTATYEGIRTAVTFSVPPQPLQRPYLDLSPGLDPFFQPGETRTIHTTALLTTGTQTVTNIATFTSLDPSVVTMNGPALTGVSPGIAEVVVTWNGLRRSFWVSVWPRPARAIR